MPFFCSSLDSLAVAKLLESNYLMALEKQPIDTSRAKAAIERGRRARWWRRKGTMKCGFSYVDADGRKITDETSLERIKALVIPPAWRFVRISPFAGSALQAVGMDTTGRVQYLYNSKFTEKRGKKKFEKIVRFGEHLPKLRAVTNEHIGLEGFPREKVLAIMLRLVNSLYIRIGSEKSVSRYKTFGISTLQNRHLTIKRGGQLIFEFVGKRSIRHRKVLVDEALAAEMNKLKQLGKARKLFHYLNDEGKPCPVKSSELNSYLKSVTSPEFSSKDFRTWAGTLLAAVELAELGPPTDEKQLKSNLVKAVRRVAEELGNTPAVCRSSYIHPTVIDKYASGQTLAEFQPRKARRIRRALDEPTPEERALLRMLTAS
jgi:DNA topoisomerase I